MSNLGNSDKLDGFVNVDPSTWTVDDVSEWIGEMGLPQYKNAFKSHSIDGLALLLLTETDIKNDLSIKVWNLLRFFWSHSSKFFG